MIGRSVGKYRILDRVGRGGMGTVYRALDDTLQREVAIKVLNAEVTEAESLKRFRTEAITLAKLHHQAIATLFELHEEDGDLMMVMEFVRGETLQRLAERMGRMPPDFAAQLCAQALEALAYAHRVGIIHRDLKPGNMMLTDDGIVKVMDFGIARIAGSEHLTSDGFTMGTPAYMAPEQVLGHEADARSDVYAMGIVLYRLWTGELPFQGDTPLSIAQKQLNDPLTPLSVACPDLPPWCDAVLARALAKDPDDRFKTAQEFRDALASSASFVALDDVATRTMETPRGLPLDKHTPAGTTPRVRSGLRDGLAISAQPRASQTSGRPGAAPTADQTGRTVVISVRHLFAGVGALALVLVLLGVGGFFAFRPAQPGTGSTDARRPSTAEAPASNPAATPQPSVSQPPVPSAAATAPPKTTEATAGGSPTPLPSKGPNAATSTTKRPNAADSAAPPAVAPPVPAAALAPATFDKLKLLVIEGEKAREQDAELELVDGRLVIYGPARRVIASMPYGAVLGLSSSRSRQPRWREADGSVKDAKLPGGALGFIKADRNWLSFLTQKGSYVFRVDDDRLGALTESATQRTGAPLSRLPR